MFLTKLMSVMYFSVIHVRTMHFLMIENSLRTNNSIVMTSDKKCYNLKTIKKQFTTMAMKIIRLIQIILRLYLKKLKYMFNNCSIR